MSRIRAFTLIEIMLVVALLGLLLAMVVPNFVRARVAAQTTSCINNLLAMNGAKEQWALEHRSVDGAVPADSELFGDDLYLGKKPSCPARGTYQINGVGSDPLCSVQGHTLSDTVVAIAPLGTGSKPRGKPGHP